MIKELPQGYQKKVIPDWNKRKTIGMWMVMCGLFVLVLQLIDKYYVVGLQGWKETNIFCGILISSLVVLVILHELAHFLVYQYYGVQPRFAIIKSKRWGICPAVKCTKYYLTRKQIVVCALMPQILTVILAIWSQFSDPYIAHIVLYLALTNLFGGLADILGSIQILRMPKDNLYIDEGDKTSVYEKVLG